MIKHFYKKEILSGQMCPYCGNASKLIDSKEKYGKSYGWMYICWDCDAYVGTHKGTTEALGRLANKQLREWKKSTHRYFDPIWESQVRKGVPKHEARAAAYEWLSKKMGIPIEETHIGMFTIEQCKEVMEHCSTKYFGT